MFQSPSHRGTASDEGHPNLAAAQEHRFNPLHIGALLRTTKPVKSKWEHPTAIVSIPFTSGHCFGQQRQNIPTRLASLVSILFTSGHCFGLGFQLVSGSVRYGF